MGWSVKYIFINNCGGTAAPAIYRSFPPPPKKFVIAFLAESGNLESFETLLFFSGTAGAAVLLKIPKLGLISDTTKKILPNYL